MATCRPTRYHDGMSKCWKIALQKLLERRNITRRPKRIKWLSYLAQSARTLQQRRDSKGDTSGRHFEDRPMRPQCSVTADKHTKKLSVMDWILTAPCETSWRIDKIQCKILQSLPLLFVDYLSPKVNRPIIIHVYLYLRLLFASWSLFRAILCALNDVDLSADVRTYPHEFLALNFICCTVCSVVASEILKTMIIPIRCFTCGKVIGNKWETYLGFLQAEYTEG